MVSRPAFTTAARLVALAALALAGVLAFSTAAQAAKASFLSSLPNEATIGSTVPANGDLNPYGVVTVLRSQGLLVRGDELISNFNNGTSAGNLQGTGTTLVELSPRTGALTLFAQIDPAHLPGPCPGGVGLTTALAVLPSGHVVVGSLPTTDGTAATAQAGCLIVLDSSGRIEKTVAGPRITGPWDMTVTAGEADTAALFVTNVLDGTVASGAIGNHNGNVVRIDVRARDERRPPSFSAPVVIATGFPQRTDPAALVIGPTGVGLGRDGKLYVADSLENRIAAVPNAVHRTTALGAGATTVSAGGALNDPLGLTIAPNGNILTANGNDGNLVETSPTGTQFPPRDTGAGGGGLFGLAVGASEHELFFVNDAVNTLQVLR